VNGALAPSYIMKIISFPTLRRGNYLLKLSEFGGSFLLIAHHMEDETKTQVRYFKDALDADIFIEFIVEKDVYG